MTDVVQRYILRETGKTVVIKLDIFNMERELALLEYAYGVAVGLIVPSKSPHAKEEVRTG